MALQGSFQLNIWHFWTFWWKSWNAHHLSLASSWPHLIGDYQAPPWLMKIQQAEMLFGFFTVSLWLCVTLGMISIQSETVPSPPPSPYLPSRIHWRGWDTSLHGASSTKICNPPSTVQEGSLNDLQKIAHASTPQIGCWSFKIFRHVLTVHFLLIA